MCWYLEHSHSRQEGKEGNRSLTWFWILFPKDACDYGNRWQSCESLREAGARGGAMSAQQSRSQAPAPGLEGHGSSSPCGTPDTWRASQGLWQKLLTHPGARADLSALAPPPSAGQYQEQSLPPGGSRSSAGRPATEDVE